MFFYTRKTLEEYRQDLIDIESAVKNHAYNKPEILQANSLIEKIGKDNQEELRIALAEENLPTLEELGSITIKNLRSWSKLHKKQKSLTKKITKLEKTWRIL